jgi:seryl-tRNA synthetase
MFDVKWIRDNPAAFDRALTRRGLRAPAERVLELDRMRRAAQAAAQAIQAGAQRALQADRRRQEQGRGRRADAWRGSPRSRTAGRGRGARCAPPSTTGRCLAGLPNLPAEDVPDGAGRAGQCRAAPHRHAARFAFKPKEHFELGEALGLMDFARAAKLSGARFVVLMGQLARLERALGQFMLDLHTTEFGYTEVSRRCWSATPRSSAPASCRSSPRTCSAPTDRPLAESPTAEVPLTNLVPDEISTRSAAAALHGADALLPLRGGRRRQGHARHDPPAPVREGRAGLDRRTGQSAEEHERMTACAEEVLKRLGLPYRVIVLSHRRHGLRRAEDLRHRGLAAGAERLSRDFELLELRRLPGAAHEGALPAEGAEGHALRAHAQRLGPGRRPRR